MAVKKLTPELLRGQIDEYFNKCGTNVFPDYPGMLLELDLFPDEVAELCNGEDATSAKYRREFERAKLRRTCWLTRLQAKDSKMGANAFNLLKQEENGGYTSASNANKVPEIRLVMDGVGGKDAFK